MATENRFITAHVNTMERGVLITGASSGIGAASAHALAEARFVCFAGVRTERDAERARATHPHIRPILLDVTDERTIAAAIDAIRASGIPLHGLVNNAGVAMGGPLEYLPLDDVRKQFEINVFGVLAVTQAALPLLRETHGRVVIVGSIGGRLAAPFVGPYSASKAAVAALADALRLELAPRGVAVSLLEFAAVKTPIWQKGRALKDDLSAKLPPQALEAYAHVISSIGRMTEREERHGMEPSAIATAVVSALTSPRPRERYLIGRQARIQSIVALLPTRLRDRLIRRAMKLP